MTTEESKTVDAVVSMLSGKTGIYDNELTEMREIWVKGKITHERPRAGCDGTFYAEWGTYSTFKDTAYLY